jgi:hypothetical protein
MSGVDRISSKWRVSYLSLSLTTDVASYFDAFASFYSTAAGRRGGITGRWFVEWP